MKKLPFLILLCIVLGAAFVSDAQVKQTPEVIEAYQICHQFQQLLSENLDFAHAFEVTFTKNLARQRMIAIYDGEFGNGNDLEGISDAALINAYKQRMQIFYLTLALVRSKGEIDSKVLFSPEIEKIIERKVPKDAHALSEYFGQLNRDAAAFRSHFDFLVRNYPAIAGSVNKFKSEMSADKFAPPVDYKVTPNRGYYRSGVIIDREEYYEINGYILLKEQGRMRIAGIRFLTRLF